MIEPPDGDSRPHWPVHNVSLILIHHGHARCPPHRLCIEPGSADLVVPYWWRSSIGYRCNFAYICTNLWSNNQHKTDAVHIIYPKMLHNPLHCLCNSCCFEIVKSWQLGEISLGYDEHETGSVSRYYIFTEGLWRIQVGCACISSCPAERQDNSSFMWYHPLYNQW